MLREWERSMYTNYLEVNEKTLWLCTGIFVWTVLHKLVLLGEGLGAPHWSVLSDLLSSLVVH